jgi:carbon-monoxide dehydrogenase large subunit
MGGSFGAKVENLCGIYAFLLAKKAGKPVKVTWTREEEFIDGRPRHSAIISMKLGAKKNGTLVAMKAEMVYDAGAYAEFGPGLTENGAQVVRGPYHIPHVAIDAYCVYTNKTVTGAYRGYGCPQAAFATESQLDILADKVGLDPLELRMKNAIEDGDRDVVGSSLSGVAVKEALREVASLSGWGKRKLKRGRALGMACGQFGHASPGPSSAMAWLYPDGTVHLSINSPNVAGSHTSLLQIVSEELKVAIGEISIASGDTDTITYEKGPIADRTIYCTGNAVRRAALDIRNQLLTHGSDFLGATKEEVELAGKHVCVKGDSNRKVPFSTINKQYGSIIGRGVFNNPGARFDLGKGTGLERHSTYEYVAQVAEVEVDQKTGHVNVLTVYAVHNCGRAINPMMVKGQIEGCVQQGLGYALWEEIQIEGGEVVNPSYLHSGIPLALDVPEVKSAIIEKPDPHGPYGAKGAGQGSILATAPAVINAIARATGVRILDLPVTPDKIVQSIAARPNR